MKQTHSVQQPSILAPLRLVARPVWALILIALSSLAGATTLLSVSIDELTQRAEFVFEGEVVSVQAQRGGSRGMVSTFVTFRIIDTIKGSAGGETLELKFLGGSFEGERLEVNGSRIPERGERGVYFVESLSQDLINPLLGWSQGQYLIQSQGGVEQVTSVDARPIVSVSAPVSSSAPDPRSASARRAAPLRLEAEPTIAEGLTSENAGSVNGLSPQAFKQGIRALLP